jgi:hypothetical protein
MKRSTLAALLGSAALVVAVPLAAQAERGGDRHGGMRGEHMKAVDANGDGDISKAEVEAFQAKIFAEADTNKDGSLTLAEMNAHHEAMEAKRKAERQQAMFAKLDADGNGKVSQAEFASQSRAMRGMERMDTDGDGTVTEEEREAARAKMKEHRGKWGHRGDGPPPEAPDAE